ncbi:phosphocholine cytidylyltransferase family protein [Sphingomonas sp.]|uniref:phosphocholine cytidylyltransferase family protein n=1 Tax=Sphingomonas sp. TaxID=28214 RepID=UPI002BDC306B|nr:phosphocholine cytidylyltransferase family protein [Sphingomonas sp.]HWK35231.1 phosphocholine cytidylyltransferase family protein [Sphingomonas sp.]
MQTSDPSPTPSAPPQPLPPVTILLAAGVGRRLGDDHDGPKVLLDFDGRSLIERHLAALSANGVTDIVVTVGHEAGALRAVLGDRAGTTLNPDYRRGSLISLWVQRDRLRSGRSVLLMDGDVLYDSRMIARLVAADGEAVLLVDRELEPGDEPVKVCFRGNAIVDFRKRPEHAHDWHGESVGFFKFSPAMAAALADICEAYMAAGRGDLEYEEAIRDLILADPAAFVAVDVTDLPWTEIDFPEDVAKARTTILPQLVD